MLTVALVITGWIALYVVVRMMLAQNSARLRQEFQRELVFFTTRIVTSARPAVQALPPDSAASTHTVAAVAAAAAALGARKVQVRPAKPQLARAGGNTWAQHGRAGVWSSHDIAQRWR